MNTIAIQYSFKLSNNIEEKFELELDAKTLKLIGNTPDPVPQWTNLDFHQCSNCPLASNTHPHCPLAVQLVTIVKKFNNIISYDEVYLEITTKERKTSQLTTAQRGISSLMGLVTASSGCPHAVFFRPMARFHLPLASEDETIYRATSMYLLAQHFVNHAGGTADIKFEGLKRIYQNMHEVNAGIAKRLKAASETDSSVNAIIMLDMFTKTIPLVIEESLDEIRYLFAPYLETMEDSE